MVTFDVTVTPKDLTNYMFCHKYKRVSGMLELLIGAVCLVAGIVNVASIEEKWQPYMLFLIFFGVFFLVILPVQTWSKSARQYLANPAYKAPFTYVLDDTGIVISQGEDSAQLPWGEVYRVVDNGKSIVVYISKFSANILPKRCFADKYDEVKKTFEEHLDKKRCRL